MGNKHFSEPPSDLVKARLDILFENLNSLHKSGAMQLESDILSNYHSALDLFFTSIEEGSISFESSKILAGQPADPIQYNNFIFWIDKDVRILFSEINSLDTLISSSFNSIISEKEQITGISKRIGNKIGNYLLYADSTLGGGFFFGDSFSSAQNLELGSVLVDKEECYHEQEEGIILLPLDGDADRPEIKSFTISDSSNGTPGNSTDAGVSGKDKLNALGDNKPNTWFEYERVTTSQSLQPLILELLITLKDRAVINHIHINPMNFGVTTPIIINDIETSEDGEDWKSIKDELPLLDFLPEEEDNLFSISPSSSKYSGQAFYSFLPRKAQYVRLFLKQPSPYSAPSPVNEELNVLRYAIGIRDINILGRKFLKEGAIVSTPFAANNEIKKVSLWASENPIEESTLADITHSISHNDGNSWYKIQPQRRNGIDIPEIINFNNIGLNSISTELPVLSLKHKISMERNTDAFDGEVNIKTERKTIEEIINIPSASTPEVVLKNKPIKETLRAVLPFWGSYSCPRSDVGKNTTPIVGRSRMMNLDFLEFSIDVPSEGSVKYDLPWDPEMIPNLSEKIRVFINGEQWERARSSENSSLVGTNTTYASGIDEYSKVYFINRRGTEIQFGLTEVKTGAPSTLGLIPKSGARIQVCLDGDNPTLELTDQGYVLNLTSNSDGFKDRVDLFVFKTLDSSSGVAKSTPVPRGVLNLKIEPSRENIQTANGLKPPIISSVFQDWNIIEYKDNEEIAFPFFEGKKNYIDGKLEFSSLFNKAAYSFDLENNVLYLNTYAEKDRRTFFTYKEIEHSEVNRDKWDFYQDPVTQALDSSKIVLHPDQVHAIKRSTSKIDENSISYNLTNDNDDTSNNDDHQEVHSWWNQKVVKGTVKPARRLFPDSAVPVEVPFVNGNEEFSQLISIENEPVILSETSVENIYEYQLKNINSSKELGVITTPVSIRSLEDPATVESQFTVPSTGVRYKTESNLIADGDWTVVTDSQEKTVTLKVYISGEPREHAVSYSYTYLDSGVDVNGLFSVDYNNGVIHFSSPTDAPGKVKFEVSLYSAFYNIAEQIEEGDIIEIDEETSKLKFSATFGMKFLKQDTALSARPQFIKVVYDSWDSTTESIKDLEPYFSPICKDIAFKAVTTDSLEEL